ncbi:MAG: SDR family oxidoreductase [Bacteroidia bacterium]|nr:SDR family oxidoreductase [Bacteroidia bacterium]
MKIFLFGATSPTGKWVLENLLAENHTVTALARNPDAMLTRHPHLNVVKGDVFNPSSYEERMPGTEVVVSLLGTGSHNKPTTLYSQGGQHILNTMRKTGIQKLITLTSGGVQTDDPVIQNSFFYKYVGLWYLRHIYADMALWEKILDRSADIDWICIRPTYLQNGALTQRYRVNNTYSPDKGWKISRADLADFITRQVTSNEFVHQKPVIAY